MTPTPPKRTPQLRFQNYSNAWLTKRIDQITEKSSNPVSVKKDEDYTQIGIRSHGKGIFHKSPVKGKSLGNKRVFWVQNNALVLNIVFAWEQAIAKTSDNEIGMVASHRFPMYLPHNDQVDIDFLLNFFLRKRGKYLLDLASPGGAGRNKTLGQKTFGELMVSIPDISEQRKIVAFLSAVDSLLDNLRTQKKSLESYKKSVVQKIYSKEIEFKDEDGTVYPKWQQFTLADLENKNAIQLGRGSVISRSDARNFPGDYPIYSSSVTNQGLFGRYGKFMFDEELITWSIDGGGHFFYRPRHRFSVTNVSGWLRVMDPTLNTRFLAIQLQHLHERKSFDYQTKAHPSVIRELYKLQLPSYKEQRKIATFVSSINRLIETKQLQIDLATSWKKGIMQGLFV